MSDDTRKTVAQLLAPMLKKTLFVRQALSKRPSAVSNHWPLLTPLPAA
jgi:hypothetical protein